MARKRRAGRPKARRTTTAPRTTTSAPRRKRRVHHRISGGTVHKTVHRRRHHTGTTSNIKNMFIEALTLAGGALLGSFVASKLPIANPKLKALAPVALGAGSAMVGKHNKLFVKLGQGMMIAGVMSTAKQFIPQLTMAGDLEGSDQLLLGAVENYIAEQPTPSYAGDEMQGDELNGWVVN